MGHILELIAQVHHCHSSLSPSSLLLPISLPLFLSLSLCLSHAVPLLPSLSTPRLSLSPSLSLPRSLFLSRSSLIPLPLSFISHTSSSLVHLSHLFLFLSRSSLT